MRPFAGLVTALVLATVGASGATSSQVKVAEKLSHLQQEDLWGEAVLRSEKVRSIKVDSMTTDSVAVIEVLGPLQRRLATYALTEIRSVRELGVHRIPRQRAPYLSTRSRWVALGIETILPGGGYHYTGQTGMGFAMMGLAGVIAGTAVATSTDAVAGWLPLAAWVKVASMLNLYDEVSAMNQPRSRP